MNNTNAPANFEFAHTHSLNVNLFACKCKITPSPDSQTRVYAKGCAKFLAALDVKHEAGQSLLEISYKPVTNGEKPVFENGEHDNELLVALPCGDMGQHLALRIDGSGAIESEIPAFHTGELVVNGSGFIEVCDFASTCSTTINQSGVINGKIAVQLKVSISASGMSEWEDVERANITIAGSGMVSLASVLKLKTAVAGSGVVTVGNDDGNDDFDE